MVETKDSRPTLSSPGLMCLGGALAISPWVQWDVASVKVQRVYRGHLGRRRFKLVWEMKEVSTLFLCSPRYPFP